MKKITSMPSGRPPVVVVVGHIDHGKSTLLDYIRKTNVVETEIGGITQRVSAYEVKSGGKTITFLDTPGHEAFTTIRARSVKIADLAIIIVSAEEGVRAQTIEALAAVAAAEIPYLVAINKIDRPTANVEQTKQGLAENNILVEDYGGNIPCLPVSAKTGEGIPELLELILLMAELAELTTDVNKPAEGFVLEATKDSKAGVIATLIIKDGRLRLGDFLVTGTIISRIKKLANFRGENVSTLEASSPAVVLGLSEIPAVGAVFASRSNKSEAEAITAKSSGQVENPVIKSADLPGQAMAFPIILKADNLGSLEAINREVGKLSTNTVTLSVIHRGLGQITENDVKLGLGTPPASIIGFNVRAKRSVIELSEKYEMVVKTFDIIYHLSEWLIEEVARRAPVVEVEETLGEIRVLKLFSHEKNRQIIGGTVTKGQAVDRERVRIIRRGTMLGEGEVIELKQQRLTVRKVDPGQQFGALVESKIAIAPGDTLIIFTRGEAGVR